MLQRERDAGMQWHRQGAQDMLGLNSAPRKLPVTMFLAEDSSSDDDEHAIANHTKHTVNNTTTPAAPAAVEQALFSRCQADNQELRANDKLKALLKNKRGNAAAAVAVAQATDEQRQKRTKQKWDNRQNLSKHYRLSSENGLLKGTSDKGVHIRMLTFAGGKARRLLACSCKPLAAQVREGRLNGRFSASWRDDDAAGRLLEFQESAHGALTVVEPPVLPPPTVKKAKVQTLLPSYGIDGRLLILRPVDTISNDGAYRAPSIALRHSSSPSGGGVEWRSPQCWSDQPSLPNREWDPALASVSYSDGSTQL